MTDPDNVPTRMTAKMFESPVDRRLVDGTTIKATDVQGYLYAPTLPAGFGDDWLVRVDGADRAIITSRTYRLSGASVFLELVLRS